MYQDCSNPAGSCWGDSFPCDYDSGAIYCTKPHHIKHSSVSWPTFSTGTWRCVEQMIDMGGSAASNLDGTDPNGRYQIWIDGVPLGDYEDLWLRTSTGLKLQHLYMAWRNTSGTSHGSVGQRFDNIVVSTQRVGCGTSTTDKTEPTTGNILPTGTVSSPATLSFTTGETCTAAYSATRVGHRYKTQFTNTNGTSHSASVAFSNGNKTEHYTCMDAAGNISVPATASFAVSTGDVTAPSVTIANTDPSTVSSDILTVTGSASDAVGVSGCKWRIGSAPNASAGTACTGTTSFGCATSGYSIGSNALHVGCYDASGNYGTDSITVSYPCKKLATPSGLSFVGLVANPPSNATLSFDWLDVTTHADGSALTGDLANYRTYFGTVSGGPYNTASSASSQISVGPTNANVTYYARVAAESSVNSICNSDQTAEISLFADTVPPVLSGLNPSGNYPKTAANVALGVTTNEAATCRHGSAGSAWSSKTAFSTTGATSHSATLAVWAGLVKRICYQCRDAMLNESAESCTTFSVSAKQKAGGFN